MMRADIGNLRFYIDRSLSVLRPCAAQLCDRNSDCYRKGAIKPSAALSTSEGPAAGHRFESSVVRRQTLALSLVLTALIAAPGRAVDSSAQVQLPKSYVKFARRLLDALRDSIEVDLSPASESEVRRKADPAKGLVKEWVQNWRDATGVAGDTSYRRITEALKLLGEFYMSKGQRARLTPELGSEILRKLDSAAAALPL